MIVATAGHVDHGKTSLVRQLTGVGEHKLSHYGDEFLEVIAQYDEDDIAQAHDDTVSESLALFRLGFDAGAIARRRGLKPATIESHLTEGIVRGEIAVTELVPLAEQERQLITDTLLETSSLKAARERLGEAYDYTTWRYLRADLHRRTALS